MFLHTTECQIEHCLECMNRTRRAEQYATNSNETVNITVDVNTDEPEWLCMNCEEGYTSDKNKTECICKY